MNRQQILLLVAGILAVVLIYQLPRVVVENETASEVEPHDFSITDEDGKLFSSLQQQLKASSDIKKSVNFADSLAELSLKYQLVDSAASYASKILQLDTSATSRYRAGMIYYKAFQATNDEDKMVEMASFAKNIFEELLQADPQNSSLKNKLAMTLMTTESPMQGVQLLREVLAEDPENRETIMNLGLLAIRSGQYDRARERFSTLMQLDSSDYESLFYLGLAYAEEGKTEEGTRILEKLIEQTDADAALRATASNYLKSL